MIQRSFEAFCREFRVTAAEREALVHYLASLRYRATVRALL